MERLKNLISEWGFKIEKEVRGKPGESFLDLLDRFYVISENNDSRDEGDEEDETDEGDGKA